MQGKFEPSIKTKNLLWAAAIYIWLTLLSPVVETNTYYSIYLLCAVLAGICRWQNHSMVDPVSPCKYNWPVFALSAFFALAVVIGNYSLFSPWAAVQSKVSAMAVFCGGVCVAEPILRYMFRRLPLATAMNNRNHCGYAFLICFLLIVGIDLGYLFFVQYPGVLTNDSVSTVEQILGVSDYNNVMPFWHTMAVKVFFDLGWALFGEINAAIATVHVAQIFFLAFSMAFAFMTLYQIGLPRGLLGVVLIFYGFIPYNIVYSVTLWKDVPFAAATLLFATGLYRVLKVDDWKWLNYGALTVGAVGFSLIRTNGWYAFAVTVLVMWALLRKNNRRVLWLLGIILLVTWLMLNPLLDILGVSGMDLTEAFAISMQQIARVVVTQENITQEEMELLGVLFDLDVVMDEYLPHIVDPIKFHALRRDNLEFVAQNWQVYLKLYIRLGLRYPAEYWKAWIEETKGYWNAGYEYWIYTFDCGGSQYGIAHSGEISFVASCYRGLFRIWEKMSTLQFTSSIGLFAWASVACFAVNLWHRRKEMLLCVPLLVLLVGLWLGSPVYAEFRYAYPMILTLPLLLGTTAFSPAEDGAFAASHGDAGQSDDA